VSNDRALRRAAPIHTAGLFPGLHAELLDLLRGLSALDWERPTWATRWRVRDVVAHMLDGDIRRLSFHRDGLAPTGGPGPGGYGDLVRYLDDLNATWVAAAERIAPRVLVDLVAVTGPQVAAFLGSLRSDADSFWPVAWAGDGPSPTWLDVGREYTERWHHQQQVREAVGAPGLATPRWLGPVLEVSAWALPRAYREAPGVAGDAVTLVVTGPAGGTWSLVRSDTGWDLFTGEAAAPRARVTLSEDTAWRLYFGYPALDAAARMRVDGDDELGRVVLKALAVMA
jgi:hypothetical protein